MGQQQFARTTTTTREPVPAEAVGTIILQTPLISGGITLAEALFVPRSHVSLIGVQKTCASLQCEIVFSADSCKIKRAGNVLCETPTNEGGTYTIDANSACVLHRCEPAKTTMHEALDASIVARQYGEANIPAEGSHCVQNTTSLTDPMNQAARMHRRLGHPSRSAMIAMKTSAFAHSTNITHLQVICGFDLGRAGIRQIDHRM